MKDLNKHYPMDDILASIKEGDSFSIDDSEFILLSHNTTIDDLSLCKLKGSNNHIYISRSSRVTYQSIKTNGIVPIQFLLVLDKKFQGHVLYMMDEDYTYHIYVYHEVDMKNKENFESLVKAKTLVYPNRTWKFYYYSDLKKMSTDFFNKSDKIGLGISNFWYQINVYKKWNKLSLLVSTFLLILSISLLVPRIMMQGINLISLSTSLSLIILSSSLILICILTNYFANKFKEK